MSERSYVSCCKHCYMSFVSDRAAEDKLRAKEEEMRLKKAHKRTEEIAIETLEDDAQVTYNGYDPKVVEQAMRHNEGKPKYSLLGLDCLEPCVRVLETGCIKYSRNNWRKGMPMTKILDSLLRHITQLQKGEMIDKESGLSHIGHIQANAMFLGNSNNINDLEE